ncbi:MSCRAMM family protein [Prauserella cavernicola]|uniref:MSCRAMM family protein n=1 Tax=Prauserella cavernicola TaxID=2800127 RepID=UPI001E62D153|nr:Ig-like domain-containing protein [Prauserella cavernicola]
MLLASALAALTLVVVAPTASAEVDEGVGHRTTPGQSWGGRDRAFDWVGSYMVGDKQVFCVSFALKAPDTDEVYQPGDELLTKWGEKLSPDVAANISYLLLRYGDTQNPDEAAALAHLLHSWTAAPRSPADLDPAKPFNEIGYDIDLQFGKLPGGAKEAVERLRADAEANRGPWTASVTAPDEAQTIGTPGEWTVGVTNAAGEGVPGVPVTLTLTDAELDGEQTVTTGEDGTATLQVSPTGENPKVAASLSAPADRPYVQDPVTADTQRVVSTGGEQELTAEATTQAVTAPGVVRVAKVDSETGKGIAGVPLRLTAADKTEPALGQDGEPIVGEDGKPAVVTSEGEQGVVTLENLRTPQEICIVEVSPPNGYDDAFDPANPPSACGTVQPGDTLVLEIANVADQVPHTIPAGDQPTTVAQSSTTSSTPVGALAGMGVLALVASGLVGLVARRRFTRD